jgi:aminocarboxymuconate-semialdehyde decarboxylase
MVVDAHAHVVVPGIGADVSWDGDGQLVSLGSLKLRAAVREFVDPDRIVEEQDRAGVDKVILSPWINIAERERARQNEALAAMVGDRVAALGTVDPDRPNELVELMGDGRISGIELPAAPDGDYLGHERFEDFWAAAEETGAFVFIHPSSHGFALPVMRDFYMWNAVGNPTETAVTAAHMTLAGVLERYPRLIVMLAHGGGAILSLRGRLRQAHLVQPNARIRLSEPPDESLRRFFYDTVTHDLDVLRGIVEFVGADHVLCGSDYPFDMGVEQPAEIVRALGLPREEEAAILGGNALRLLDRPASYAMTTTPAKEKAHG